MRSIAAPKQWPRGVPPLVVALVLVVSACAGSEHELVAGASDTTVPPALTREAIAEQRAVWEDTGVGTYAYEIDSRCECEWAGRFRVVVAGGAVHDVEALAGPPEPYRVHHGFTVDDLFDALDEALAVGAEEGQASSAGARFDPAIGHPTELTVTWAAGAAWTATIEGFTTEVELAPPVDPTLVLLVSNQSFDDPQMGVRITVGDEVLVDSTFPVRNQHHVVAYRVPLPPGGHELRIESGSGALHTETVEVAAGALRYVAVSYWSGYDDVPGPYFTVLQSDEPFGFG